MLKTIFISPCMVGREVTGATVGMLVGSSDGNFDGLTEGLVVDRRVDGDADGTNEGDCECSPDGAAEAVTCGADDGDSLEFGVGASVL